MDTIGERVTVARKAAGISKKAELAERVGMTDAGIGQIESNRTKNPQPGNLLAIADACGVDFRWLITGRGEMRPATPGGEVAERYAGAEPHRQLVIDVLLGIRKSEELPTGADGVLEAVLKLCAPPDKSGTAIDSARMA